MAQSILIVEDEPSLRGVLDEKFGKEGYEILDASNGQSGLAMAIEHHPDLILLDLVMPVMDGMTMLTELRKDDWGKTAKVIILSNLADGAKAVEAKEQRTEDYMVKSDWTIHDLVAKVKESLSS